MSAILAIAGGSWFLTMSPVQAADPAPTLGKPLPTLPFSIKVTEETFGDNDRPDYMSPKNPSWGMDFPFCPVVIDGEFWVFSKNGYQKPVYRYKGTNIENATRQPDGVAPELQTGMYILGGVWYNADEKKLYAPLHTEIKGLVKPILREIHLASSTDKGLTWKYEGPIITDNPPNTPRRSPKDFKGKIHSGGDGDHLIYVDERGGFIYIFTDHYTWGGAPFLRHCVVRCPISEKMAPGKWRKFYEGQWNEPGLGGKASYVNGYCVTYNNYLKKYLSFNYLSGISMCSDLSKQDWSPSFFLGGKLWGVEGLYGMWPVNAEKNDVAHSGEQFYVYGSWWTAGKRFRIDLSQGETRPDFGFTSPSVWFKTENQAQAIVTMNPGSMYDFDSFVESSDPVESRKTRRVGCLDPRVTYSGGWSVDETLPVVPARYEGKGKSTTERGASMEFTFQGKDIYWRALIGPKQGKADVYLDGVLQTTVDCSASQPLLYQFSFIKRGLGGPGPHTIKVVAKGEKGQLSSHTAITHLQFEEAAE
jgi:hypothetical protein